MAGKHWNTRNLRTDTTPGLVPPGLIVMWSGAQVPAGWALCDGQNGTPDLRDRFVVGAGGSYAVGATGGVASHSHSHGTVSGWTSMSLDTGETGGGTVLERILSGWHRHSYSAPTGTVTLDNRPPYYALAYIMKLPYTPPTDGTHYNEGNLRPDSGLLPMGAILAWSGPLDSIPSGWRLCDGQGGTPDLRDRFVVGAGGGYAVGATGGSALLTHRHTISGTTGGAIDLVLSVDAWNNWWMGSPNDHTHSFSGETDDTSIDNRPPYYALAFIMRA